MTRSRRRKGIAAWLVTWEALGPRAEAEIKDPVAAVLDPRLPGRRVTEIMELLYANAFYDLDERLDLVRRKHGNPYPAQFDVIDGAMWEGHITCGAHPFLEARRVDGLRVERDGGGQQRLVLE
jgi:hypothetical protein